MRAASVSYLLFTVPASQRTGYFGIQRKADAVPVSHSDYFIYKTVDLRRSAGSDVALQGGRHGRREAVEYVETDRDDLFAEVDPHGSCKLLDLRLPGDIRPC